MAGRDEAFLQPLGDYHRPVAPSGASDADVEIAAALAFEQGKEKREEILQPIEKRFRIRILEDIPADARVFTGEGLEIRHEIRIAQEAHVEQQIDVVRAADLIT